MTVPSGTLTSLPDAVDQLDRLRDRHLLGRRDDVDQDRVLELERMNMRLNIAGNDFFACCVDDLSTIRHRRHPVACIDDAISFDPYIAGHPLLEDGMEV